MSRRRRRASGRGPWGLAVVLAALVAAGFAADRLAPAQDLPWKPFSLNRPIGAFTHFQLARIGYDEPACEAALAAGDVDFTPVAPRREGDCHVLNGVRLGEGLAPLKPAAPMMSCQEALAFAAWERHAVQPAARAAFGRPAVQIEHFGTYACRPIRGQTRGLSEHAFADAIDVSAFRLSDGRLISVLKDYRDPGPDGAFLRRVHGQACRVFGHALGPDFNPEHRDHFHLDMGLWGPCR
ncbi:MAG: extensin family protein [Caulobacteraceae bacterium]|nr:extensin family protein [Caulobacteraceae bacterium]